MGRDQPEVRLRLSSSAQAYLHDPVGHYFMGGSCLAFCHRGNLMGSTVWGRPDEADVAFLVSTWSIDDLLDSRYEAITDLSRLEALPRSAFDILTGGRRRQGGRKVGRHAIICPPVEAAALVAGFFAQVPATHERPVYNDRLSAYASLSHPDGPALLAELDRILAAAITDKPVSRELAGYIRSHLREATLMSSARAMGRSVRTLQRELDAEGTSYRVERDKAQAEKAEQLIRNSALKLADIAAQVGCSSPSQLTRLVRRMTGVSPSALRK